MYGKLLAKALTMSGLFALNFILLRFISIYTYLHVLEKITCLLFTLINPPDMKHSEGNQIVLLIWLMCVSSGGPNE